MTDTLTAEALAAMSPREIDALVAERVMGLIRGQDFGEWPEHQWVRDEWGNIDRMAYEAGDHHNGPECERCEYGYCEHCQSGPSQPCRIYAPPYSTSHDVCAEVLARVAKMGKGVDFAYTLRRMLVKAMGTANDFDVLTATPRQKCEAALLAVQEVGRKSCEQSQPAPQHTERSRPVHPVLLEILAQQRAKGLSEYGTELHSHNGRAALLDALQEAVDGLHYLTQALMEAWDRIAELEAANFSPPPR